MDAKQFLAEFGHIVNAPNGVERLREMILALAMKGDLVEQLDGAENGKLNVERIYKRKQKYKENGELKKQKPLLELSKGELPERIPEGWGYARLGNLLNVINGRAYKKDELWLFRISRGSTQYLVFRKQDPAALDIQPNMLE